MAHESGRQPVCKFGKRIVFSQPRISAQVLIFTNLPPCVYYNEFQFQYANFTYCFNIVLSVIKLVSLSNPYCDVTFYRLEPAVVI